MILAFTDTETTHLSADTGEVWEVAIILRDTDSTDTDVEHVWQFRPLDMGAANPKSLAIGRFEERFVVPDECTAAYITDGDIDPMNRVDAIEEITAFLRGAILIGSNAAFDDRFLRKLLNLRGEEQPWHYRPICIATLAAGYRFGQAASGAYGGDFTFATDYPQLPFKSYDMSRAVGVDPPAKDIAHTALGDAKWAMAVFDAVTGGGAR